MIGTMLITGGAGFIGSHIVRRLLELGLDVRVIDNLVTGFRHNLDEVSDSIDFQVADIRDPRACEKAVEGVDVVFHVAALPSVPAASTRRLAVKVAASSVLDSTASTSTMSVPCGSRNRCTSHGR